MGFFNIQYLWVFSYFGGVFGGGGFGGLPGRFNV